MRTPSLRLATPSRPAWPLRLTAAAALLSLALAAAAQGLFYREVERDGRIYVFNDMQAFARWETSGETGKAITRTNFGPDGQTVVFDSDEAVNAYLFRHGRPGEVFSRPPEKQPTLKLSWKDGKTTIETDSVKLNLGNRIQLRSTLVDPERDGADTVGSFRVRRAKTKLDGWFYTPGLEFELQVNWPSSDLLEDANFNWVIAGGRSFMLKAGQFKVPFGRQELTSSGSQQFVDRSLASNEFARGRDIGVQVWGSLLDSRLEYRAGVFNGAGISRVSANDNDEYQLAGRVQFQPWGDPKYSESDFESKDRPLLALAANFDLNDQRPGAEDRGVKREHFGVDGVVKFKGFFGFAELFLGTRTNVAEAETDVRGFTAQAGYLVVPQKLELAARYSLVDLDTDADDNERIELGATLNYFVKKHNLKWQNDFRQLENKAATEGERKTFEFRSQLQFVF